MDQKVFTHENLFADLSKSIYIIEYLKLDGKLNTCIVTRQPFILEKFIGKGFDDPLTLQREVKNSFIYVFNMTHLILMKIQLNKIVSIKEYTEELPIMRYFEDIKQISYDELYNRLSKRILNIKFINLKGELVTAAATLQSNVLFKNIKGKALSRLQRNDEDRDKNILTAYDSDNNNFVFINLKTIIEIKGRSRNKKNTKKERHQSKSEGSLLIVKTIVKDKSARPKILGFIVKDLGSNKNLIVTKDEAIELAETRKIENAVVKDRAGTKYLRAAQGFISLTDEKFLMVYKDIPSTSPVRIILDRKMYNNMELSAKLIG